MFNYGKDILIKCKERNLPISEIVMDTEIKRSKATREEINDKLLKTLSVMRESSEYAINNDVKSMSGLIGGEAKKVHAYLESGKSLSGDLVVLAMAKALSTSEVNASMGRIVAAPTAGASGILPSALLSAQKKLNLNDETLIKGLLNASAIGEISAKNATISGAEGGCQAECGVASAMGASAIVEMSGGTPEECFTAASFALINVMGLICDPVAGLVEFPCALRNASGVINALISADLALAGVESIIPFDEVVDAMYRVGNAMPDTLKETAMGGLAITETGNAIKKRTCCRL